MCARECVHHEARCHGGSLVVVACEARYARVEEQHRVLHPVETPLHLTSSSHPLQNAFTSILILFRNKEYLHYNREPKHFFFPRTSKQFRISSQ